MTDAELLHQYVQSRSHEAFAEIVRRHADWVHTCARRLVREPHHAEDVTQAVFLILAQKAAAISAKTPLNGWLFKVTRYAAGHLLRADARRSFHEKEAAAMSREVLPNDRDETEKHLSESLDELVGKLSNEDRQAILLRFYEQKKMADVGEALAVSEDAAKKRVAKAIERLRSLFRRKGITVGVGVFASSLGALKVYPASASLVSQCAAVSSGAVPSIAVASIAKGALTTMFAMKLKVAAVVLLILMALPIIGVGTYRLRGDSERAATSQPTTPVPEAASVTAPVAAPTGAWLATTIQMSGADAPAEFQNATFIFSGGSMTMVGPKMQNDAGTISFHPSTNPPSFETVSQGQTCHGIYRFDGDSLTLCWALPGVPAPAEFATHAGDNRILASLKRLPNATTPPSPTTEPSRVELRIACARNLRDIGMAIQTYRNKNHAKYPPDLGTLAKAENIAPSTFICPASGNTVPADITPEVAPLWINQNSDYTYLGASVPHLNRHPDLVVAYDRDDNNHGNLGMNLLYVDGHVEWLKLDLAHALIEKTKSLK